MRCSFRAVRVVVRVGASNACACFIRALHKHFDGRLRATITEVESNHVPMLSNPKLVLDVIRKAAETI